MDVRRETYLGPRRLRFLATFALLAPTHLCFTWLCFVLDHLFFPAFRTMQVYKPLFIVGNFRSGSTFLFRTLAKDTRSFTALSTREIYVTPSICQRKLWDLGRRLDRFFGRPVGRFIHRFDGTVLEAVPYHKVGLSEPEEDEGLLFYRWSSLFLWFFFPKTAGQSPLLAFDRDVSSKKRGSLLRFYRRCLQRHLYYHFGPGRPSPPAPRILSKNPAFTGKLRSLAGEFPDARIVCLVRDPVELLPSMANWFSFCWRYFNDGRRTFLFPALVRDTAFFWYRYPLTVADLIPHRMRFLWFGRLVTRFASVVTELYRFADVAADPAERGIVGGEDARRERRGGLTAEEVGLTTEEIRGALAETMRAYANLQGEAWIDGPPDLP